jgi:predicted PurR-regulated permease PerM
MPNNSKTNVKPRSIYSYVILGAALFAFIQTFLLLSPILLSFLLILLIGLALNPMISRMRAFTGGRKGAMALIVAALVAFIALTSWAFFGRMKDSVTKLTEELPAYWERLQKPPIKTEQKAVLSEEKLQAEVSTEIAQTATDEGKPAAARQTSQPAPPQPTKDSESIRSKLSQMLHGMVGSFTAVAFNATQSLVVLVTVVFGVIFTLIDPHPIFSAMFLIVPARHHAKAVTILRRVGRFVPIWAFATLLAMLTVGFLVFLLMWPFFGCVDALVLGRIAGVFEAIPYLGPILSAVPALLFALGEGGMTPVWVLLAYLAVQALENNVIAPLIMAHSMKWQCAIHS